MYGRIAAHKMLHCSKTAWNAPKLGAGRMNESPGLVCIPLPSPFLSAVGERGGRAALGSQSVLERHTADKRWPGASLALAWQSMGSAPGLPGDQLFCAPGSTLCAASPQKADFHKESFSIQ